MKSTLMLISLSFLLCNHQPPDRAVVNDLFEASDADNSGGIDRQEFNIILGVSCAQILTRILVNYATMIFFIPYLAQKIVDRWGIKEGSYMETVCEQIVGLILFLLVIPLLWNRIDREANQTAGRNAQRQQSCRHLINDNGKEKSTEERKEESGQSNNNPNANKKDD
jgi:hypothetical protein